MVAGFRTRHGQDLRFVTRNTGGPARNALEEYERIKDNIDAVITSCGADSILFPLSGPIDTMHHIIVSLC